MLNENSVIVKLSELGFYESGAFDTEILKFSPDIIAMCEMNSCGRYGTSWNCPPAVGTLEELKTACLAFRRGILINTVTELEDSFDFEGMMRASAGLCKKLREAANLFSPEFLRSQGEDEAVRIFGSGSCYPCKKCTYPDEPCRHPDMRFTPIEACGINVTELSRAAGLHYNNGKDTVTFFGMILYGNK